MTSEDIRSTPDSITGNGDLTPSGTNDKNIDDDLTSEVENEPLATIENSTTGSKVGGEFQDQTELESSELFQITEDDDRTSKPRFDDSAARALASSCEKFSDLPIEQKVQEAIHQLGWSAPTPVQKLCLPFTLHGRDVAGFAQTGTGKTGVFLITACNQLLREQKASQVGDGRLPRVIVLVPTRELAIQVHDDAQNIFKHTGLTSVAIFGGVDYDKQASQLRQGVDVIVATPGRLMDYAKKSVVDLSNIKIFVCDEADRMFDMGFIEDVEFFLKRIPETAQKLLFSATTNEQVKELAFEYLETPEYISVNPEVLTPEKIEQSAIHVHAKDKLKVMMGLLQDQSPECAIIFTNTKLTAEWLWFKLSKNGFEVDLITGDLPQKKRIRLIERIKRGELKALIATDVASRGLHISRVTHVYNFDLPDDPSNYIHRIGRTARAGARGSAVSLVCDDYGQNLTAINNLLGPTYALQSTWFDTKYLNIEDKAGNPFQQEDKGHLIHKRTKMERGDFRNAPRDSHQRSTKSSRNYRPEQGEKYFEARGQDNIDSRSDANLNKRKRRRHRPHGENASRDRHDQHRGQKHSSHGLFERHGHPKDSKHPNRGLNKDNRGSELPVSQPKGLFAMLKAIFFSLFGRRKH